METVRSWYFNGLVLTGNPFLLEVDQGTRMGVSGLLWWKKWSVQKGFRSCQKIAYSSSWLVANSWMSSLLFPRWALFTACSNTSSNKDRKQWSGYYSSWFVIVGNRFSSSKLKLICFEDASQRNRCSSIGEDSDVLLLLLRCWFALSSEPNRDGVSWSRSSQLF